MGGFTCGGGGGCTPLLVLQKKYPYQSQIVDKI